MNYRDIWNDLTEVISPPPGNTLRIYIYMVESHCQDVVLIQFLPNRQYIHDFTYYELSIKQEIVRKIMTNKQNFFFLIMSVMLKSITSAPKPKLQIL